MLLSAPIAPPPRPALKIDSLPRTVAGYPARYYWRPTIRLGQYTHPVTGQRFAVTPQRIDKWMANFSRMRANGRAVYIPVNHSQKAEDNRGFVLDMRRNGEWLEELHQYIGDDAALTAARSKVSLNIQPVKDAYGNIYDEAIEHSSLVVNPVILGQSEPSIAASASGFATHDDSQTAAGETFFLSATELSENTAMFQLTDAQVAALRNVYGADLTPETLVDRATQKHTALSACQTSLSAATNELTGLRLSASANILSGPALSALVTATTRAKDAAVAAGAINKPTADKLFAKLVKPNKDSINALALSASGVENDDVPLALSVFEALAENKPMKIGTLTGAQQILNAPAADNAQSDDAADREKEIKELEEVGRQAGKQK